jgi:microcystin degradation protein MlrC
LRFGIARIFQKSNSFARSVTTLAEFEQHEMITGNWITDTYANTGTTLGGMIEALKELSIGAAPLMAARAPASGPVEAEAVEQLSELLCKQISNNGTLDGVLLDLSGSMVTQQGDSGEELILNTLKRAHPDLKVALTLPPQANVTNLIVEHSEVIVGVEPVPAADPSRAGRDCVHILRELVSGSCAAESNIETLPLLIPVAAQRVDTEPFMSIYNEISDIRKQDGVLNVSLFAGNPYVDAAHTGATVVVTTTGHSSEELARQLTGMLWKVRSQFFVEGSNVEEAVHHAMASKRGPVLIADLGDNPDDGAPGDGTTILWALIDLGVRNATVGAIADEQAIEACFRAGTNGKVEIPVGGRRDTRHGYPIDISARVRSLHEGLFTLFGPVHSGLTIDAGRIAVLDVDARHDGHVELILTEQPVQILDRSFFDHIGIDVTERNIVSIKSTIDYRPEFEGIASKIFEVITPGITTPDPAFYAYQRVKRPVYPLDAID